jgi:hypothetical protein
MTFKMEHTAAEYVLAAERAAGHMNSSLGADSVYVAAHAQAVTANLKLAEMAFKTERAAAVRGLHNEGIKGLPVPPGLSGDAATGGTSDLVGREVPGEQ